MKLPILISVPHGGIKIPEEVEELVKLEQPDIYDDIDPFARQIFNLEDKVKAYVDTPYARTFLDVNRATDDLPPENMDGVVKSHTRLGLPVYSSDLSSGIVSQLISRYYDPFHQKIEEALKDPEIVLGIDCHTMGSVGGFYAPDAGQKRPLICLSNMDGATCSMNTLSYLADCLARAFKIPRVAIALNDPFKGGHIIKKWRKSGTPWLQVELNRTLYMERQEYGPHGPMINTARIRELNWQWLRALTQFIRGNLHQTALSEEMTV
jgi:formiminoglutamase